MDLIVKRLLKAWGGRPEGEIVVVPKEDDPDLVKEGTVDPVNKTKELIAAWSAPDGVVYPVGTRVGLDKSAEEELEKIEVLRVTVIGTTRSPLA